MKMLSTLSDVRPWYCEPWPWILMAGPFTVLVAGIVTYALALNSENSLVVDNYYKDGLAINRVIEREQSARLHSYAADVQFSASDAVRVRLHGTGVLPNGLILRFIHPTQLRQDRSVALASRGAGVYEGVLTQTEIARSSKWYVHIEDAANTWRMTGVWNAQQREPLSLQLNPR